MRKRNLQVKMFLWMIPMLLMLHGCGSEGDVSWHQLIGGWHVNTAPVATPQTVILNEDSTKTLTLSGTDTDGDTLSYKDIQNPSHGSLSGTAPNLTYTPVANYHGSDSFTFRVNDGTVDSAPATVSITVTPVNDAPVAVDDVAETRSMIPVTIDILSNDSDIDGTLAAASITLSTPANGIATVDTNGIVTYTSNSGFSGTDTLAYHVKDNEGAVSNSASVVIIVKSATCWQTISDPVLDINQSEAAELPMMTRFLQTNGQYVAWTEGGRNTSSVYVKQYNEMSNNWQSLGGALNSSNMLISDRTVISIDPSDGIPYVYYRQDTSGHEVARWNGVSWEKIYTDTAWANQYDLALTGTGIPFIVYGGGDFLLRLKKYDGSATWEALPSLDLHTYPYVPRMLIKEDGNPIIVVDVVPSNYGHTKIYDFNGTAWNFQGYLESNATNRQIACRSMILDQKGDLVIAYVEKSTPNPGDYDPHIFVKRFGDEGVDILGSELNGALSVDTTGGLESGANFRKCISIAEGADGTYYIVWQHRPSGQKREIHTLKYEGTSWSEATEPLKDDQNLRLPTLVIDANEKMNISVSYDSTPNATDGDDVKVYKCDQSLAEDSSGTN